MNSNNEARQSVMPEGILKVKAILKPSKMDLGD